MGAEEEDEEGAAEEEEGPAPPPPEAAGGFPLPPHPVLGLAASGWGLCQAPQLGG